MINLALLESQPFDMGTIYLKDSQPIHIDANVSIRVLDEEVHITRENVLIQTSKEDPGKHALVLEVIASNLITGFVLIKYNLVETIPPGLIVTKRGQA